MYRRQACRSRFYPIAADSPATRAGLEELQPPELLAAANPIPTPASLPHRHIVTAVAKAPALQRLGAAVFGWQVVVVVMVRSMWSHSYHTPENKITLSLTP